jgi:hypothetical protein
VQLRNVIYENENYIELLTIVINGIYIFWMVLEFQVHPPHTADIAVLLD